ncbi:MAG: hypothetical protein EZS28_022857 [Streblomastix strix]|uniref:DWNN domain-containing protein n=1 Tax=Streblomastix strix TaxID=222440 RepID=A0A5J4VG97_9EUKA|nr:MAG: hypothetical protein EZS28_022857 [Streblomastix strix]
MEYVEYRLHMQPNFQRVNFDGYHIQVADLREEICTRENINKRDYYLKLLDEKTEKEYQDNDVVTKKSRVIVLRTRIEQKHQPLPSIKDMNPRRVAVNNLNPDFEKHDEIETSFQPSDLIMHLANQFPEPRQKNQKWSTNNNSRGSGNMRRDRRELVCDNCKEVGHHKDRCPKLFPSGIPRSRMKVVHNDEDDNQRKLVNEQQDTVEVITDVNQLNIMREQMGDYPWNNYETVRVKRPRDDDGDNEFIQMKRPRLGDSPHTSYGNKTNDIDMDLSHINSQSNIGQSSNLQQIDPIQNNFPSTSTPLTLSA